MRQAGDRAGERPCGGLGATVALMCDIIIAAEEAKIGDPHVNAGLVAGDGGALIWPQLIGFARAKEYLFTGDLMTRSEAHRIGLINHVVPADGAGREGVWTGAAAGNRGDEVDPVDQAGDQYSAAADRAFADGSELSLETHRMRAGPPGGGFGVRGEAGAEVYRGIGEAYFRARRIAPMPTSALPNSAMEAGSGTVIPIELLTWP